ncbi:cadmium-translocating P-type ATPase [Geovibrio thiophilus]|uniref:P-type Zn(2+) transporter n=2 Tax=Geovibrio thiophilus TaxID=139438 RepID=A0A3R5X4U9_9BACT|nr:cadmium-translocating P-type ATPase [Geovibrio thiophilus]
MPHRDTEVKQTRSASLNIQGLDCADCAAKLEGAIQRMAGVTEAQINFAAAKLKVVFDEAVLSIDEIIGTVTGFGYRASEKTENGITAVFKLSGLDCADCAAKLEKRISSIKGVSSAKVNFSTSKMTVTHSVQEEEIINAVRQAGYQAVKHGEKAMVKTWRQQPRMLSVIAAGFILVFAAVLDKSGSNDSVVTALYALVMALGGFHVAKSGFYALKSMTLDMNFLMITAAVGAAAIGEWSEGATVVFLFSLGNALQAYTMDKTRSSIRALMELAPPEALVRKNGAETLMRVENIDIGDIVIVKPGERIAVDGTVSGGSSAVNQAAITGESMPADKNAGDSVYAGTVNTHGALEITVTRKAEDSTLSKIMHAVEEAQAQKAPMQQFVDVFAKYYTPAVILGAAAVAVIPPLLLGAEFGTWFYRALVLLVISCPCALVISTPVSIVSAIGNSSRNGVLIKGGAYMEKLGQVKAIAFDKTGTLTHGRPQITDIVPLSPSFSEQDILTLAAAVEKWSEHPIAKAVTAGASEYSVQYSENFRAFPGKGAKADVNGKTVYVGSVRLFEEAGQSAAAHEETLRRLEEQGKTVIFIGSANEIFGAVAVADTLRHNSSDAVQALRKTGITHIAMLTGDNRRVAEAVAADLDIDSIYSSLLPEDKSSAMKELKKKYGTAAMVGDGVNDAPALAVSDIGIAMGVAGSDTALETADIALMADDLGKLSYVIRLSRKTLAVIKQNITFSIAVKVLFIAGTFFGFVNLWLAVLADMGASLLVTLNGMRLIKKV